MSTAAYIAVIASGLFFMTGLLCGAWKYYHIHMSREAKAPVYVDIAHRAALLYAFAALLIERFVELSRLSPTMETTAVIAQVGFFAFAITTYVVHGVLRDTDNQLKRPYTLGPLKLPSPLMVGAMVALMVGEIGGFGVLLWGTLM